MANILTAFLFARCCSKSSAYINSFNPHNNLWGRNYFITRALTPKEVKSLWSQSHRTDRQQCWVWNPGVWLQTTGVNRHTPHLCLTALQAWWRVERGGFSDTLGCCLIGQKCITELPVTGEESGAIGVLSWPYWGDARKEEGWRWLGGASNADMQVIYLSGSRFL